MCDKRRLRSAWASALSHHSQLSGELMTQGLFYMYSEDPGQTGRMLGLILVFAGRTCLFHYENTFIQIHLYIENFTTKKWQLFRLKNLIFFIFLLKKIDCGYSLEPPRRGGSNEYPQSMFLSRNTKNNVYPFKSQFYYIKMGFKGVKII